MIDKYGRCPNCNKNWDAGDIRENISKVVAFQHKSAKELDKIAANYGWTEFNKTRFTITSTTELEDSRTLVRCHEIRCGRYFDLETGKQYYTILDAISNNEVPKEVNTIKEVEIEDDVSEFDTLEDFDNYFKL